MPGEVLIQSEFPDHALYDAVCRQVADKLLAYDRFRQKVVQDAMGAQWVLDDEFDIHRHVVRETLPRGNSTMTGLTDTGVATFMCPGRGRPAWNARSHHSAVQYRLTGREAVGIARAVCEVLRYLQYDPEDMIERVRRQAERASRSPQSSSASRRCVGSAAGAASISRVFASTPASSRIG